MFRLNASKTHILPHFVFIIICFTLNLIQNSTQASLSPANSSTPLSKQTKIIGVNSELIESLCLNDSARLQVDLALMIVHVKKETSFNYKLYLFSNDHVFQTGQVVPRADFRIHAFPARAKTVTQFGYPRAVDLPHFLRPSEWRDTSLELKSRSNLVSEVSSPEIPPASLLSSSRSSTTTTEVPTTLTPSSSSDLIASATSLQSRELKHNPEFSSSEYSQIVIDNNKQVQQRKRRSILSPIDASLASLPGDNAGDDNDDEGRVDVSPERSKQTNKVKTAVSPNSKIDFDLDDQVETLSSPQLNDINYSSRYARSYDNKDPLQQASITKQTRITPLVPVASFNSFVVNCTYLVRKDFGDSSATLVKLLIDPQKFEIANAISGSLKDPNGQFLRHDILKDPNTRILAITQIYEDWIDRNFYTFVYIQRLLDINNSQQVTNQRLVFKDSSDELLGSDSLSYVVTAAAFVTELRGLHYFLEFLEDGNFYLSAVSWSVKPYVIFSNARFALKPLVTKYDTKELLLCYPSLCNSEQPIDEIIPYGHIDFKSNSSLSSNELKLHLRDWNWQLLRPNSNLDSKLDKFELFDARRSDLKPQQDNYGFPLVGSDIDASLRVQNELFLISANQVLRVRYASENETFVSRYLIGELFEGLTASLMEPITAVLYDTNTNQVYFFKGDRYVGYDFKTKLPLDDFILSAAKVDEPTLVSTLPTAMMFGISVTVDAVFADTNSDLIYVFTGMKFFALKSKDFKDGSFVTKDGKRKLRSDTQFSCTNEEFISGCKFTDLKPNKCKLSEAEKNAFSVLTDLDDELVSDNPLDNNDQIESPASVRRFGNLRASPNLAINDNNRNNIKAQNRSKGEKAVVYALLAVFSVCLVASCSLLVMAIVWLSRLGPSCCGRQVDLSKKDSRDNERKRKISDAVRKFSNPKPARGEAHLGTGSRQGKYTTDNRELPMENNIPMPRRGVVEFVSNL